MLKEILNEDIAAHGLVLHKKDASPPSCAVMMLGRILGVEFDYREPDMLGLEHMTPEFKQMNPMSTVPVLQDGDFVVSESHAIMKYLITKYGGENSSLYPSEPRARAIVDQCLFFDAGPLFNALKSVAKPTLLASLPGPTLKNQKDIEEAYAVVEAYLQDRHYVAADHLTLADLSVGTSVTGLRTIHPLDKDAYPRCHEWLESLEQEQFYKDIATPGIAQFGKLMQHFWVKNKMSTEYLLLLFNPNLIARSVSAKTSQNKELLT